MRLHYKLLIYFLIFQIALFGQCPGNAGADRSVAYCGPGQILDMKTYLASGVATTGTWADISVTPATAGTLNTTNGLWYTDLVTPGTYKFRYTLNNGCPTPDFAEFTVIIGNVPTVNLGPDKVICNTGTVTLDAGVFPSYLWGNGSTGQTLAVSTTGTYNVRVKTLGNNVITNGDFEAGNTGFTTQYKYCPCTGFGCTGCGGAFGQLTNPATCSVNTSPRNVHNNFYVCADHTPGAGANMMIVNGSTTANTQVWCQNITTLQPGTNYEFGAWASSAENTDAASVAKLQFSINGTPLGSVFTPSLTGCTWTQFTSDWFSGTVTNANICLVNQNTAGNNDFLLDDITFRPICYSYDTINVTVRPTTTATFNPIASFCIGTTAPTLPTTSTNTPAFTGTWSPNAVTTSPVGTYTYTFTPTAGQCAETTTLTIQVTAAPPVSLTTPAAFCPGATAPILVNPSGVTGSWNPPTVDNTVAGTYTYTPDPGQCLISASITTVLSPETPVSLTTPAAFCSGASAPILINPSGVTGVWNPTTTSNTVAATHTFTPDPGQCKTSASITTILSPSTAVSLSTPASICPGEPAPALVDPSGVTGTWNPTTVSNTVTGTHTFTPDPGQCKTSASITVTVKPETPVSLSTPTAICPGEPAPALVDPSGITGTWNPTTVSNTVTGTHTFTPDPGQCKTSASITVTVKPETPVSLSTPAAICPGEPAPALVDPSGVTGTWSPSSVSNTTTANYTFSPDPGQCKTSAAITVTIKPETPVTLSPIADFCYGTAAPTLPPTSSDGKTGTWDPTTIDNTVNGTYVFTPDAGQCATSASISVNITPETTPTFDPITPLCGGEPAPNLQKPSLEGITGNWSPATVNNSVTGTYTFTPDAGQCAKTTQIIITVGPPSAPVFTPLAPFCEGLSPAPSLPHPSTNGVTGTWSPNVVNTTATGTYLFTPTPGLCATTTDMTVVVNPKQNPTFPAPAIYCKGDVIAPLPLPSNEGITGTWGPTINNQNTTVYTFTPAGTECANSTTLSITVNPPTTPLFAPITPICVGETAPVLPGSSTNSIVGTWDPSTVDNTVTKTYTFTPDPGQCAETTTLTVTVNNGATIVVPPVTTCANTDVILTATGANTYVWSPPGGLSATTGATVTANVPITTTYHVVGTTASGCTGATDVTVTINGALTITVNPAAPNICSGGSVVLTASGANNYTWSPSATLSGSTGATVTANPLATTTYTIDGESNGCIGQGTITVTVGPPTQATFTQIPGFCSGTTAPNFVTPSLEGITGSWSPSTINNTTNGTYTFTPTTGLCAVGTTMNITVNPAPALGSVTPLCDGTNTNYTLEVILTGGTPTFTMTANAPNTGITGTLTGSTWLSNPIASGTGYNLNFVDSKGCGPVNVTGIKNCNCATAVGTMSNTPISICQGATATGVYNTAGENLDANDTKQFVLHTNAGGTLGTIITRSASPTFSFGAGMTFGTTYYISAIVGDNSGGGTVDINDPCLAIATGQPVVWNATPTTTVSNNGPICVGATLDILTPVVIGTYAWTLPDGSTSTQQNLSFPSATLANAGTYSLVITVNGCPSTAVTTTAVVNAIPVATPSNNGPICQGETLNLTAASVVGATSYNWSNTASGFNSTSQNPSLVNATLANAGTYNLTVTVGTGAGACTSPSVGTTVVINPTITLTASASKTTICANDPVGTVLTGTGGTPANYQWNPVTALTPTTGNNVTAKPNTNTTYILSDPTALCSNTASVTITVDPVPVMANLTDQPGCDKFAVNIPPFTMTPTGGNPATSGFTWVNSNTNIGLSTPNGNGNIPSFTGKGIVGTTNISTFTVTPTRNGCKGLDETVVITVHPIPVYTATYNAPVCEGTTLILNPSTNQPQNFQWSWTGPNGFTSNSEDATKTSTVPTDAGTYSVTITDNFGCIATTTVDVTIISPVNPVPTQIGPFCENITVAQDLGQPNASGGTWSAPTGVTNNTFTPSVAGAGTHTVNYINNDVCPGTASYDIVVNPMPAVSLQLSDPGCSPLTMNLTTDPNMDLTTWTFGDGTSANDITKSGLISNVYNNPGLYDVTVTNTLKGCSTSKTFTEAVEVFADPVASFSAKNKLLYLTDPTAIFTNNTTNAVSYAWDFGDNTSSTGTNPRHTYDEVAATYTIRLTATSTNGCTDETSQTIQIKDELLFFVPNTFTPDGDQHNNVFQPVFTSGFDAQNFTMFIYNRWGEIIFESHNTEIGWDGTYQGEIVREGIYSWTMEVKDPGSDNKFDFQGHIFLVR